MKVEMKLELNVPDATSPVAIADAISHLLWSLQDLDRRGMVRDLAFNGVPVMLPSKLVWR